MSRRRVGLALVGVIGRKPGVAGWDRVQPGRKHLGSMRQTKKARAGSPNIKPTTCSRPARSTCFNWSPAAPSPVGSI
jgi:hypothetical protein